MLTYHPHLLIITETWLRTDVSDDEITPQGYRIYRKDRSSRGGGVAIIFKETLQVERLADIPDLECVIVKVDTGDLKFIVGAFYRPPGTDEAFFDKLNEFLCMVHSCSSNIIVGGDFNVPSVIWDTDFPVPSSNAAKRLVDIVLFHDLTQLVKQPTRVQNATATTLDLFFVSNSMLRRVADTNVLDGISDHKLVYMCINLNDVPKGKREERVVSVFSRAKDVEILDTLDLHFSRFTLLSECSTCTVNNLWCFFKNLVLQCVHDFVPEKVKIIKNVSPWITMPVVRLGRKANRIRKQHRQNPTPSTMLKLSNVRKELKDSIKEAKDQYYNVTLENFLLSSPAKFWQHFAPNKKRFHNICVHGTIVTNKETIAESFNTFFCSVFTDDDGRRPCSKTLHDIPPISDLAISEEGILSLLLNIDPKKTPGIDSIPNAFLVRYAEWCSKFLCIIFQK